VNSCPFSGSFKWNSLPLRGRAPTLTRLPPPLVSPISPFPPPPHYAHPFSSPPLVSCLHLPIFCLGLGCSPSFFSGYVFFFATSPFSSFPFLTRLTKSDLEDWSPCVFYTEHTSHDLFDFSLRGYLVLLSSDSVGAWLFFCLLVAGPLFPTPSRACGAPSFFVLCGPRDTFYSSPPPPCFVWSKRPFSPGF